MPTYPKHPCGTPGCPELVERGKARCDKHTTSHRRQTEAERGSAHARGYTRDWSAARALFLSENPLCAECMKVGRITPARVVDHIVPHRGDPGLFWDRSNWQSLCDFTSPYNCHGMKTASGK